MHVKYVPVLSVLAMVLSRGNGEKSKGEWSGWGEWSQCSRTCGPGTISRTSTWIEAEGEKKFDPPYTLTQSWDCDDNLPCPVDGRWSMWSRWGECSEACGGGIRRRTRFCSRPVNGGALCEGEDFEEEDCNIVPCPPLPKNFNMSICTKSRFFNCTSNRMCIPVEAMCDDIVQCHDGSDEKRCFDLHDGLGNSRYSHVKDSAHVLGPFTAFGYMILTIAYCYILG